MALITRQLDPGEVADIAPLGFELTTAQVAPLIKTQDLEVFRVVVPGGSGVPAHRFSTEVIVHCLEGRAKIVSARQSFDLAAGQLVYLSSNDSFSIVGLESASLLITAARSKTGRNVELIG